MRLHENQQLFADAIEAAARPVQDGGLGIKSIFIEKDYWICRSLSLMATGDKDNRAIFKGGTSLTKAYGIGARFSEDIDVAIAEAWTLSGNQLKNLIRRTSKNMTAGLEELVIPGMTSKGSHYHKAFYTYPRAIDTEQVGAIRAGQLLVEINSFANPYPFERRSLCSFLTEFLQATGNNRMIEEYGMQPFEVNVLDRRRTLTEKLVSLIRCSLANLYMPQLTAKIRHFYDLHHLLKDEECLTYLHSDAFPEDFRSLLEHDRQSFDKPEGWRDRRLEESPLMTDLPQVWGNLQTVYMGELPDLAYRAIPAPSDVEESIRRLMALLREFGSGLYVVQQCQRTQSYISGLPVDGYNRAYLVRLCLGCFLYGSAAHRVKPGFCRFLFGHFRGCPVPAVAVGQGQRIAPALFDDRIYRFPDSI